MSESVLARPKRVGQMGYPTQTDICGNKGNVVFTTEPKWT
jgi:hypothetical protein